MKGLTIFVVISLLLISFVCAKEMASNAYSDSEQTATRDSYSAPEDSLRERIQNKLNDSQIKEIFREKNRIRIKNQTENCTEHCNCTGSVTKCWLANGTREMTIIAGKSGNIIIQIKGMNASTNVTLYKSEDGKLYAVLKNNETKIVKLLPDQAREQIRARFARNFDNESINLNEDGTYTYIGEKKAKLFLLFPVKSYVKAEFDPETGKLIQIKNPWWGFLSRDENADTIIGASCGTVTPGENNNCCKSRGFDAWNETTTECQFSKDN